MEPGGGLTQVQEEHVFGGGEPTRRDQLGADGHQLPADLGEDEHDVVLGEFAYAGELPCPVRARSPRPGPAPGRVDGRAR